jgi:hypothetical protein
MPENFGDFGHGLRKRPNFVLTPGHWIQKPAGGELRHVLLKSFNPEGDSGGKEDGHTHSTGYAENNADRGNPLNLGAQASGTSQTLIQDALFFFQHGLNYGLHLAAILIGSQ